MRLEIEKHGNIHSGYIDYDIVLEDGGTAIVLWNAKVKVKKGFLSKTFRSSDKETVPVSTVKSTSYREVGQRQEYQGKFAVAVVNTDGSTSVLSLVSKEYNCSGEIVADVTENFVIVNNLKISGKAYGMSLTIKAHRV